MTNPTAEEIEAAAIKTFVITVRGHQPMRYSARTRGKAIAQCWREYNSVFENSFRNFLGLISVERVPNPPGVGDRIMVAGEPATRVLGNGGQYIRYMRDNSDVIFSSHPLDVTLIAAARVREKQG